MSCPFCEIVAKRAPARVIYQDDAIVAFMTLRSFAAGECTIIPIAHIDHFSDVPDDIAQRIIVAAQRISRRMRTVFAQERVGMIVHGYGVQHAHLILVPQNGPNDITSVHYVSIEDGAIRISLKNIPFTPREVLDEHARLLIRQ